MTNPAAVGADVDPATQLTCASCGAPLHGRYCQECGERVVDTREFTIRAFISRGLASVLNLDARFYRSFRLLLTRPGTLTAEYMAGRRKPYLSPIQLFLVANLIFFAGLNVVRGVVTFTTPLEYHQLAGVYGPTARNLVASHGPEGSDERVEFERRFNETVPRFANSMVILLAPVLAVLCALLTLGRRRYFFVQHLIFSLHMLAFLLIVLLVAPVIARAVILVAPPAARLFDDDNFFSLIMLLVIGLHLSRATRRAYDVGPTRAALIGFAMAALFIPALLVYRMMLFFVVYAAVS